MQTEKSNTVYKSCVVVNCKATKRSTCSSGAMMLMLIWYPAIRQNFSCRQDRILGKRTGRPL
jgi:hypothetical protein